jgi:hypothetical protein
MNTPVITDPPPYVPVRHSGWPVRRTPLWALLALVVLAGAAALVSLAHKPSQAQQASDLNAYMKDMNAAVESCAGGVTESAQALSAIESGSMGLQTAVNLVKYNAANCSPANNQSLADLTQYQVTESLSRFHLAECTNDFVTWAFPDAMQAQTDMLSVLTATSPGTRSHASAMLRADLGKLDKERAVIYSVLGSAERALADHQALPRLPG